MPKDRQGFFNRRIGERIRALRESAGLSQTELGKEAGLSYQQIQKFENSKNRVSASTLADIIHALNTESASIFEGLVEEYIAELGFSETDQKRYMSPPPLDSDTARRLREAYGRISDPKARESLACIAELLADAEGPGAKRPRKRPRERSNGQ